MSASTTNVSFGHKGYQEIRLVAVMFLFELYYLMFLCDFLLCFLSLTNSELLILLPVDYPTHSRLKDSKN